VVVIVEEQTPLEGQVTCIRGGDLKHKRLLSLNLVSLSLPFLSFSPLSPVFFMLRTQRRDEE